MPPVLRAVRELKPRKSVIVAGLDQGADVPASFIAEMRELGVPYFPSTERAFRAVKRINDFATRSFDASNALPIRLPLPARRTVVPEYESKALLKQVDVPFSAGAFAVNVDDAVKAAKALGYPVALKAQSEQLSHKSEAGGVILGVADDEALRAAWQRMHDNVRAYDASIVLDGILIEAMGQRGLEMIIGAKTDPEWGPVILAGLGGVTAEVIKDVRLLDADLTVPEILAELDQLQSAALFHGFRGAPELDMQAVAELIARVGQVLRGTPALREIDLNPVVVYPQGKGAVALDALMLIDTATGGASS